MEKQEEQRRDYRELDYIPVGGPGVNPRNFDYIPGVIEEPEKKEEKKEEEKEKKKLGRPIKKD